MANSLRSKFHALLHRCRQRKSLRVVALGQRLRHFTNRIDTTVGEAHGERLRHWFEVAPTLNGSIFMKQTDTVAGLLSHGEPLRV